jgi:6-phosphogluconolactonase
MTVEVLKASGDLDGALAQVARRIFKVCSTKSAQEPLVLGLCGGRSVVGLLSALERESVHQPKELLGRIQFFMVDERLVPITDDQSNFGGLKKLLFDSLVERNVISENQLHPFNPNTDLPDFGCGAYLNQLRSHGGKFTVVVVGVGEDGHIAGLFPRHPSLQETRESFVHFDDSPKPPPNRMSASPSLITGAALSVVLALGEGKRGAWEAFCAPEVSVADCPAKLATTAQSCVVVTDLVR